LSEPSVASVPYVLDLIEPALAKVT